MTWQQLRTADRPALQEYLESRGFAVYDSEDTESLREAAILDAKEVTEDAPRCWADRATRPEDLCPFCDGIGFVSNGPVDNDCPDCDGTGRI